MISVIIPDYKNPKYLDMCLKSAIENQHEINEIIVVIDGEYSGYREVVDNPKYKPYIKVLTFKENKGLSMALNLGVSQASNEYVLLVNEDNVFPRAWDMICDDLTMESTSDNFYCFNQIEPNPSMYDYVTLPYGDSLETFKYDWFLEYESKLRDSSPIINCGATFPFLMKKKVYMGVGGFDLMYPSPFIVDWDFFYKVQTMGIRCDRRYDINFYHFVNKSTKKNDNIDENTKMKFSINEQKALDIFRYKWGFTPTRLKENNWRITK